MGSWAEEIKRLRLKLQQLEELEAQEELEAKQGQAPVCTCQGSISLQPFCPQHWIEETHA